MYKEAIRPAWAEISLGNLDYNIKNIIKKVGRDVEVIGVIKADGYGHGRVRVAEVVRKKGGITEEIIMLGLTPDLYADTIIQYDITPVVCSLSNAAAISRAAETSGKIIKGFVAIDTGMGRIGYQTEDPDAIPEILRMETLPGFQVKGIFSHFATADAADKTYAKEQEKKYNRFCEKLTAAGGKIPMRTFANSAAVMELPSVHFDAVRPGIILYGCYPSAEVDKGQLDLKPAMSVKANIIHLKKVPAGSTISYGRKFTASRESLIATLALGYADGYPRPYSLVGRVIVNGQFAPIAGNICMDQCMIDVTDVPDVKEGDEVIIMGSDGTNTILADEIADATGTINYEIVCAFGQRLPKIYVE